MGKVVLRNVLGFIAGLAVYFIVEFLAGIVFGFLLQINLIATLLSFPSSPMLWATTGMYMAACFAAASCCSAICLKNSKNQKLGTMVLGIVLVCGFILTGINVFNQFGFDWDRLVGVIFGIGCGAFIAYSGFKGEEI